MKRIFTKTFLRFFFGFLAILAVSFSILIVAAGNQATPAGAGEALGEGR